MSGHPDPIRSTALTVLSFAVIGFLAGCPTINSANFSKFHNSVSKMQASTDLLFADTADTAKANYIQGITVGPADAFMDLQLDFEPDFKYAATAKPSYALIEELQSGLFEYNQALVDYTALLAKLADAENTDQTKIAELAQSLNDNLQEANTALNEVLTSAGKNTNDLSSEASGIFSAISAAILEQHIKNKRIKALREVMDASQETIKDFSALGQKAIQAAGGDVNNNYTFWFQQTSREYFDDAATIDLLTGKQKVLNTSEEVDGGPASLAPDEIKLLNEAKERQADRRAALINHNTATTNALDAYKKIHKAYGNLPQAHLDLRQSLDKEPDGFDALILFYKQVRQVETLYKKISKD